jgi:hypothetical protein
MPTINRIRIINFSYNNDTRHIMDECFNFHGGDNALLNLANGGGKSVLVQLFLQPVVPGIKIQGRNIAGFFRKQKQPTFILLEWKLDGGGGYLLTGLAMVPVESTPDEEISRKIRYFTFTCKYHGSNAFDILHIPLAEKRGNMLHLLSFKEARELMREKEHKDPYLFSYFSEDDNSDYSKHLAGYGIVQNEWRNVIAKINDNEGGLEEIFQKYKTSSQLLDEWIIKNIEKSIFREKEELHRLEEMLEKLVEEVTENESYIQEREILTAFLHHYGEQSKQFADLLQGLDRQSVLAGHLAALDLHLAFQLVSLEEDIEENKKQQEDMQQEEKRIELEERSQTYIQRKEVYEAALELGHAVREQLMATGKALEQAKLEAKIMQAAKLHRDILSKEAKRSGLEERLQANRASFDQDQRIKELEYSLKILLEKELAALQENEARLHTDKKDAESALKTVNDDLQELKDKKSACDQNKGRLEERKNYLAKNTTDILKKLDLHFRRNLLGELNPTELEQTRTELENTLVALQSKEKRLFAERTTSSEQIKEYDDEVSRIQTQQNQAQANLQDLNRDRQAYEQQERDMKNILLKYDLEPDLLFQTERLKAMFKSRIQSLAQSAERAGVVWHETQENLLSLKNGQLHVPPELVELLSQLDIQYDTGESYLRGLSSQQCQKMLEGNPLLPYAFIIHQNDLVTISEAAEDLTVKRVVPFLTYEDLQLKMGSRERIVQSDLGIALACFYEGRVFTPNSMENLIAELEQKSSKARQQHEHYSEEHRSTVTDWVTCSRFSYPADYRYNLSLKQKETEEKIAELDLKVKQIKLKKTELMARIETIGKEILANQKEQLEAESKISLFKDFIEQESEYQTCCQELNQVLEDIKNLLSKQKNREEQQRVLQEKISSLQNELRDNTVKLKETRQNYERYKNAPQADFVEGSFEELTEKLQALSSKYRGVVEELERQSRELLAEILERKATLRKLKLQEETYISVKYREEQEDRITEEIRSLEIEEKKLQQEQVEAATNEGSAKTAVDNAYEEVKRLGYELPLDPAEITGDFPARRKQVRSRRNELVSEARRLQNRQYLYGRLKDQIAQIVDTEGIREGNDFVPAQDLEAQLQDLGQQYRAQDNQNRTEIRQLQTAYSRLREDYREKNTNIDNIFRALNSLWEDALTDVDISSRKPLPYERFYFLYESMLTHHEKLSELLKVYELQLANLERNKHDMIEQSFLHGMRIAEEILWISDNSKVRLQGRSRPVQMLKIDLATDSAENAKERMKQYIEEAVEQVRQDSRQNKRPDEIKRRVSKLMSSRELLNTYLGNAHIPVSVYKIDYTMQNSRLKLWEDAVRENSGGEKFVVFFSVLSALMSYARNRAMENLGGAADKDSSVLIMDNPFGPISSEHLLNPLFEIAKKHRTQLICLSDLKQNSIMNCFNLIYMLKIRSAAIGNKEYLKFEEIIRDSGSLQDDERLEKAVFRSEVQQLSMF